MPTLASQSTAAVVRRARRRERRVATRARRCPQFFYSSFTTANRKHIRQRQSRDRASYDVEHCLNTCQDRGYHHDPDVHLGSGVRIDINQFSVLEHDIPCPSNVASFPWNEFTFSYPSPCTPLIAEQTAPASEPLVSTVSTPSDILRLERSQWPASSKVDTPTAPGSPLSPSITTTPFAEPRIKLPGSFPDLATSPPLIACPSVGTGYLDGIKIPSPLLYHKRSRERLERSSDDNIDVELARAFSLTCGRDVPEPDFESYKPFDDIAVARTPSAVEHGFVAARLPFMEPSMVESTASRNIPQPPWVEQLKQSSSSSTSPSSLITTDTRTRSRSSRPRSDSDATVIGPSCSVTHGNNQPRIGRPSMDLVFPTLNVPEGCMNGSKKVTSPGLWQPPANKPHFIDDDPVTVFNRWSAFEHAISHPKIVDAVSSTTDRSSHAFNRARFGDIAPYGLRMASPTPSTTEVAVCPTSTCMALVPARLYEHQYLGWPKRPAHEPNYSLGSHPILGSSLIVGPGFDNVLKMSKWVPELGFESKHEPKCPLAADVTKSFDEDFRVSSETEAGDVLARARSQDSNFASESSETPVVEIRDDEGYFTCQESGSEIGVDEAALSDDEWADWNWDIEMQEEAQNVDASNDEDTEVDLFGIGWDF